jgi:hypothetical protein
MMMAGMVRRCKIVGCVEASEGPGHTFMSGVKPLGAYFGHTPEVGHSTHSSGIVVRVLRMSWEPQSIMMYT